MKSFSIVMVEHLSIVMALLSVPDTDAFTANVGTTSYGDAAYTLIHRERFWADFIRDNVEARLMDVTISFDDFIALMDSHDILYINLEG